MEPLDITLILSLVFGLSLLVCWLDFKMGWQLSAWINGRVDNPFMTLKSADDKQTLTEKDATIKALTERIQILEKIVTEPAYELNKKINQL